MEESAAAAAITTKKKRKMKIAKKRGWRRRRQMIDRLPQDVIVEITAIVASSSSTPVGDITRLRSTCKRFYKASMEDLVGRSMAVEKEDNMCWWHHNTYFSLLRYCARRGNPQASLLLALNEIGRLQREDVGMRHLESAVRSGSCAAKYLMGIIFFQRSANRDRGMTLLNNAAAAVDQSSATAGTVRSGDPRVAVCRKQVADAARKFWIRRQSLIGAAAAEEGLRPCAKATCGKITSSSGLDWGEVEENREFCSQQCRWNHEIFKLQERL
ncbi:hypothetical protein KSP40_PGU013662 [Platanthera guangdongensis]|uniref:At2g35280-like TPR domain-containing protein n=1 Tax=Platanthera guangdongensis TaxID=2320717 RepID=A0ABR2LWD3_9ASPA